LVDIRYPNWKQVWPTKVPDTKVPFVGINPDYLIAARKAFSAIDRGDIIGVRVIPTSEGTGPYLVAPSGGENLVKVILMPCR
jgi:hypothetical protein